MDRGLRSFHRKNSKRQIATEGAAWLDRELTAREPQVIADSGFGRDVKSALQRRAERLVEIGYATVREGTVRIPSLTVANLEQREVDRVGREMAVFARLAPVGYHKV